MSSFRLGVSVFTCALIANLVHAEERRLEEIVVTAEKRESTVSDISISITALGEDMIEDFGIQGADELVNFIPAFTQKISASLPQKAGFMMSHVLRR